MRKLLVAVVALGGLTALGATGAVAQPYEGRPHPEMERHAEMERPMMRHADYDHGHHHYHHRRWDHGRWHYWD